MDRHSIMGKCYLVLARTRIHYWHRRLGTLLAPWALIVSCICLAIISRQMKKRHASKDHLTTIVRVSFIVMSISLFICGLAMPDFSDMETFSTLSVYTNNAISFKTSKTIAIISGFVVVLSLFVAVTFGIAEDKE